LKNFELVILNQRQIHEIQFLQFSLHYKIIFHFSEDTTLKAWDTATKKEICTMSGHKEAVTAVKILDLASSKEIYSDGGHVVISGSTDCYAKFWHVPTGTFQF
jgi:WD40 repeat protein